MINLAKEEALEILTGLTYMAGVSAQANITDKAYFDILGILTQMIHKKLLPTDKEE